MLQDASEPINRGKSLQPINHIPNAGGALCNKDLRDWDAPENRLDQARLLARPPAKEALKLQVDVELLFLINADPLADGQGIAVCPDFGARFVYLALKFHAAQVWSGRHVLSIVCFVSVSAIDFGAGFEREELFDFLIARTIALYTTDVTLPSSQCSQRYRICCSRP
jgi:hypothetical protein